MPREAKTVRKFSKAERKAYGQIMRAKRERAAAHGSRYSAPKTHRQHLYSGKGTRPATGQP